MRALFRKDFCAFFTGVKGYLFLAAFLAVGAGSLCAFAGELSIARTQELMANFHMGLIFLLPVLTMDSFSREQLLGTDKLLLSGPLSVSAIVLAKFAATYAVYLIALALCAAPVTIYLLASGLPAGPLLTMLLGLTLFGMAAVALGNFLSSLSPRPLRAGIFTLLVLMVLWMVYSVLPGVTNTLLYSVLSGFSLFGRLVALEYGFLRLSSVVYLCSFAIVFWLLTCMSIDLRRAGKV